MQASMSRKGNCWDNGPMESCWGSLKTELVHHCRFATREQAKREITEYLEIFYPTASESRLDSPSVARRFQSAVLCEADDRLTRWTPRLTTDLKPGSSKSKGTD